MHRRTLSLTLIALALTAGLALAEPRFLLSYPGGVPQVAISGDYTQSHYIVSRAPAGGGEFVAITERSVLCLGSCFAPDPTAIPGASYLYRFDLLLADGTGASYGPFPATISPALGRAVGLFVYPNPARGTTGIQVHLAGAAGDPPVEGVLAIHDLAGRRIRLLHRGSVARGLTTLTWDGRDARGVELGAGVYLARFTAGGSSAVARIVRR